MSIKNVIDVLVIEPGKKPYGMEIGSDEDSILRTINANIMQAVFPYDDPVALICDDEGKMIGKKLNRALRDEDGHIYDVVAGTFLIAGVGEDCFVSLDPDLMVYFSEKFKTPEMFMQTGECLFVLPFKENDEASVVSAIKNFMDGESY